MPDQLTFDFQRQRNTVADEVAALTSVVRPILTATLYALKRDIVDKAGGYPALSLDMLARLYRPGDGDCGLCFEYAVHDAMTRGEATVTERLTDALKRCNITGHDPASILFGMEKTGQLQLIDTAKERLTDESSLMYGSRGRPVKLKRHIDAVAAAFKRPAARLALPQSISGLWKADLFVGCTDAERWVGTSVKINPKQLEPAAGLRIGIVPSRQGNSDGIRRDEQKNLVVCPLPHDGDFMEIFYQGWGIVQQFIDADAHVPSEVRLPRPAERQVARYLEDRRKFPVLDVVDALAPLAQPELLESSQEGVDVITTHTPDAHIGLVVAPMPRPV